MLLSLPLATLLLSCAPAEPAATQESGAEATTAAKGSEPAAPALIVMISIDQLIPEQLVRLEDRMPGGLGLLHREGLRLERASLPYNCTETGPGHASMATGCLPRNHGIVGNVMRIRDKGTTVYCVADSEAYPVTSKGKGEKGSVSAVNLQKPSLGGYLKKHNPASKVVSVSGKDRSAVCMAGKAGDFALWWGKPGGFESSTAFVDGLPAYVQAYNATWASRFAGLVWNASFAADEWPKGTQADDRAGERIFPKGDRALPHELFGEKGNAPAAEHHELLSSQVQYSPFGDQATLEMARVLIREEGLGSDAVTDFLGLGLSGVDKIGHMFGPFSVEITDCLLRLDADLGKLFAELDESVGKGRWVVALTSDHGVLPIPESTQEFDDIESMSRITSEEYAATQKALSAALGEEFGLDDKGRALRPHFMGGELFFRPKDILERKLDGVLVRKFAAEFLRGVDWVQGAYTLEELAAEISTEDPMLRFYQNAYHAKYSPDVSIVRNPGTILAWTEGTTHGSPYHYDRDIPLYFYGLGFAAGVDQREAASHDVVPTLLSLVGLHPSGLDGRNLLAK